MLEYLETGVPDIVGFRLSGKMLEKDHQALVPYIEETVKREGSVKLFAELEDFHGWDWHAAWDELRFGARHYRDIRRIAMVGDRKWEERLVDLVKPFTHAEVRYFDKDRMNAAWYWLQDEDR
jgi:hypothetical protein